MDAGNYVRNSDGTLTPATPLRGSWWVRMELTLRRWLGTSRVGLYGRGGNGTGSGEARP